MNEQIDMLQQTLSESQRERDEISNSEISEMRKQIKALQQSKTEMETERDLLDETYREALDQLKSELTKVNEQNTQLREDSNAQKKYIIILLCTGGVLMAVIAILGAVLCYKTGPVASRNIERALRDQREMILKANESLPVIPSVHANRLGVNEHPVVRDQFGMKEVFDVTAGEGKDLVRIARPLETAGAERKLSEELMDIQPIIVGREGAQSTGTGVILGTAEQRERCKVAKMRLDLTTK